MTHYWRIKTKLPERQYQRCRLLARGTMNSCLVEFEDGYLVIASRNAVRKLKDESTPQGTKHGR